MECVGDRVASEFAVLLLLQPIAGMFLLPTEENVLNKSAMLSRHTDKEQAQTLAPSAAH